MFVLRAHGGFIPMRMNKSGNQSVGTNATNTQVINWVSDGAYPGTVIVSHKLVVAAGTGKRLQVQIPWSGTSPWNKSAQIFKNNAAFDSVQSSTTASGTFAWDLTNQTFLDGDTLEVRVSTTSTGITILATGCFMMVTDS